MFHLKAFGIGLSIFLGIALFAFLLVYLPYIPIFLIFVLACYGFGSEILKGVNK